MGIIATRSLDEQVTGIKDLIDEHEVRIRNGMVAYGLLENYALVKKHQRSAQHLKKLS